MILVLSTYPDRKSADEAAQSLVEKELAACVSIISIAQSVYRWKGKLEKSPEYLLIIKTTEKAYPQLETHIKNTHPHSVPEIVYLEVKGGQKAYLDWVNESCNSSARLLRVPLDLSALKRASEPPSELRSAKKPKTLS
ncbi:divalent-cation tolerance protein CutA [Candidatus Micrarchaeota archaeon]|nr:divalent-cation tolerance protein CutA [Candidatus Micrarchaeota archaeon]